MGSGVPRTAGQGPSAGVILSAGNPLRTMPEQATPDHGIGTTPPELGGATFPEANIRAVQAVAGALASTLGPTPRDKLVVTALASRQPDNPNNPPRDEFAVATDGATILEELPLEHPIAPLVRRLIGPERPGDSDIEGQDIPDGVTTSVVLAAALLDEAADLLEMGVHQADICAGYQAALSVATDTLAAAARPLDPGRERERAEAIARSAMNGNDIGGLVTDWARVAVDIAAQVGHPTAKTLAVRTKRTGRISDSRLVRGAVLDRNGRADERMPRAVDDASVLVLGGHGTGGLVDPEPEGDWSADSSADFAELATAFDGRRDTVVADLLAAGVDAVLAREGISSEYAEALADHGVLGIRRVNRLKLTQAARATGATIVHDPTDVTAEDLGWAERVAVENHDPRPGRRRKRKMTLIEGCEDPDSVTALLPGTFDQGGEQLTRQLRKGAKAVAAAAGDGVSHGGYLPGAGAVDVALARAVREAATAYGSKVQLAVERFADAAEMVLFTLAKNAGDDPLGAVADTRARQRAEPDGERYGYVVPDGVADAVDAGVFDAHARRRESYTAGTQVANLILGIDQAVAATVSVDRADPEDTIYDGRAEQVQQARENGQ